MLTLQHILGIKEPENYCIRLNSLDRFTTYSSRIRLVHDKERLIEDFGFAQSAKLKRPAPQYNMTRPYTIHFIEYGNKQWLFAGVFKNGDLIVKQTEDDFIRQYQLTEVEGYEELVGRLVVQHNRQPSEQGRKFNLEHADSVNKFTLLTILERKDDGLEYNGHSNVNLSFDELELIIKAENPAWKAALSHMFAIYLITDVKTGKLYVGSAYGRDSLWGRWSGYVATYHNGNKGLKTLVDSEGEDYYRENMRFSILETIDDSQNINHVIARENHWKEILQSRKHGYNEN